MPERSSLYTNIQAHLVSHVLRGNAGLDALRPVYATLPVTRGAARLDGIPTRRVGMRNVGAGRLT